MPESRNAFKLEQTGALTTGVKDRWVAEFPGEIIDVDGVVGTAPTGATLICDIKKNGTTVYTTTANRPTAAISATVVAGSKPDVATFTTGDVLSLDILQIGSGTAGSDLDLEVEYVAT